MCVYCAVCVCCAVSCVGLLCACAVCMRLRVLSCMCVRVCACVRACQPVSPRRYSALPPSRGYGRRRWSVYYRHVATPGLRQRWYRVADFTAVHSSPPLRLSCPRRWSHVTGTDGYTARPAPGPAADVLSILRSHGSLDPLSFSLR